MRVGNLFNGIGGFALAASWMGWTNIFHCEIDPFCNKVMKRHFPNSIEHGNIKETDFKAYSGAIDLITGGFPCQPYSTAGKRLGKADERHLWPEMLRAIREISPRWVVGENVRGLISWNGGMVFDEVQINLEAEDYEVLSFLLPACAVNAPHRRERIWFVAHTKSIGKREQADAVNAVTIGGETRPMPSGFGRVGITPDTAREQDRRLQQSGLSTDVGASYQPNEWNLFSSVPAVCRGNDEFPDRVDQLKSLGNAVVPQLVYQIFKAIDQYETLTHQLNIQER